MKKEQFMLEAIQLSQQGMRAGDGGPFGAVIVKDGQIIGRGWNRVLKNADPTAHAEVEAIRDACRHLNEFDLSGAEIYTSCEPCPMCLSAIYWARLSKIYYANNRQDAAAIDFDDAMIYEEVAKPMNQRRIPMHEICHQEALPVFQEWESKADKIGY